MRALGQDRAASMEGVCRKGLHDLYPFACEGRSVCRMTVGCGGRVRERSVWLWRAITVRLYYIVYGYGIVGSGNGRSPGVEVWSGQPVPVHVRGIAISVWYWRVWRLHRASCDVRVQAFRFGAKC